MAAPIRADLSLPISLTWNSRLRISTRDVQLHVSAEPPATPHRADLSGPIGCLFSISTWYSSNAEIRPRSLLCWILPEGTQNYRAYMQPLRKDSHGVYIYVIREPEFLSGGKMRGQLAPLPHPPPLSHAGEVQEAICGPQSRRGTPAAKSTTPAQGGKTKIKVTGRFD